MIAVVTGGTGFIGRNLVHRLLTDGHEVRCLVRPTSAETTHGARRWVVQFDDPRSLMTCDALDGAHVVFHLAGLTKATTAEAFTAANVTPVRHLLAALAAHRLGARVVYVSSQAAAGPSESIEHPIDESAAPRPVEPYGASKLAAEHVVQTFRDSLPVVIVRPCAIFGPYDRDFLTLFRFAERGVVLYPSTADHWMSLLHVSDAVNGIVAAAQRNEAVGRIYSLASHGAVQWRTLGDEIGRAAGRRVRHVNVPRLLVGTGATIGEWAGRLTHRVFIANHSKAAFVRYPYWVCDAGRARRELAFNASCSLPDAVRDTYYWYRQNGWLRGRRRTATTVT